MFKAAGFMKIQETVTLFLEWVFLAAAQIGEQQLNTAKASSFPGNQNLEMWIQIDNQNMINKWKSTGLGTAPSYPAILGSNLTAGKTNPMEIIYRQPLLYCIVAQLEKAKKVILITTVMQTQCL